MVGAAGCEDWTGTGRAAACGGNGGGTVFPCTPPGDCGPLEPLGLVWFP